MPTKKRDDTGWVGFVDVTLSSREKEAFQAWDVEGEDLWTLLVDTLVSGHKLSVSYNRANDTFGAAFTGNGEDTANKGYTLSAYGADWYTAVRVLLFKHVVLLEGVWANAKGREGERIG